MYKFTREKCLEKLYIKILVEGIAVSISKCILIKKSYVKTCRIQLKLIRRKSIALHTHLKNKD